MHPWMYETQAKIKLDSRFKEADDWRRWRQANPVGRGLAARAMSFISGTFRRILSLLGRSARSMQETPAPAAPDRRVEAAYPTQAQ